MKFLLIFSAFFLFSCSSTKKAISGIETPLPKNISLNGKLYTALFMQRAAEYRALCLQGYNIARMRMENYIPLSAKSRAIITDIDETILDNSAYAVHQAFIGKEYIVEDWFDWTAMAAADTMPGAASLLNYAATKNIEVFYLTNREEKERIGTLKNLQHFNLPFADEKHLITRLTTSSKEARRQQLMNNYEIVLLLGDNLADFSSLFDKKSEAERKANVDLTSGEFGKKFIMFPNPNYGDWESSLYRFKNGLGQGQKDSIIRSVLKTY